MLSHSKAEWVRETNAHPTKEHYQALGAWRELQERDKSQDDTTEGSSVHNVAHHLFSHAGHCFQFISRFYLSLSCLPKDR